MNNALAGALAMGLMTTPAAAQLVPSNPEECRASHAEVAPLMEQLSTLGLAIESIAAGSRNERSAPRAEDQRALREADRACDKGEEILERLVRFCGTRALDPAGEIRATIGELRQMLAIKRLSAELVTE